MNTSADPRDPWQIINSSWASYHAETQRIGSDDLTAVEVATLALERELGVFSRDLNTLPGDRRSVVGVLIGELGLHGCAFCDGRADPFRFRECFALAARHSNVRVTARGPLCCVALKNGWDPNGTFCIGRSDAN